MVTKCTDYTEKLLEKFQDIEIKDINRIVIHAMKKIESAVCGKRLDVQIGDGRELYMYFGYLIHDQKERTKRDNRLKFRRASYASRERKDKFEGFYYVGMTRSEYTKYLRNKKRNKKVKFSKRVFTTNILLLQQIQRYEFIVKVKFPFSLQYVTMTDWECDPEDITLFKVKREKKWKRFKEIYFEKESIKTQTPSVSQKTV